MGFFFLVKKVRGSEGLEFGRVKLQDGFDVHGKLSGKDELKVDSTDPDSPAF